MLQTLTRAEYEFLLRHDFTTFAGRCFQDLNPQTDLAINWHLEVIAAKLTEVREGKIRRLIINLPPRHLKSLMASIAFPAWCLERAAIGKISSDPDRSKRVIANRRVDPRSRRAPADHAPGGGLIHGFACADRLCNRSLTLRVHVR
jgi:hypothetical protein